MGIVEWFKELGKAEKVAFVVSGVAVAATAYGAYRFYKSSKESSDMSSFDESDEEGGLPEKKVLVLGLEGAGKTVFLSALSQPESTDCRETTKPTEGFHVVCLTTDGLSLNIWEIGGSKKDYWPNFIGDTNLLVYVVDSTDTAKFEEAKKALHCLLGEYRLHGIPVVLVTTKNDKPGAKTLGEVQSAMGLDSKLSSQSKVRAVGIQVKDDGCCEGLDEARGLILQFCK